MEFVWLIIGLLIGGGMGYAVALLIGRSSLATLRTESALAEQRAQSLQQQLSETAAQLSAERSAREESDRIATQSSTTLTNLQKRLEHTESAFVEQQKTTLQTASALARVTAERDTANQRLDEQKLAIDQMLLQMRDQFASLSQQTLTKNAEQFLQLATEKFQQLSTAAAGTLDERKAQIEGLLKPLNESLQHYQQRLAQIETSRQEGYGKLLEQLSTVNEIGRKLDLQTTQLVTALRRPTTRGRWGELTLRRLVELAGLSEHCDFTEQVSTDTDESRQRPDLVIHTPGGGTVIVDAKATLDAFLDASGCDDDVQRVAHLTRHAHSVRNRARDLSLKSYWQQFQAAPEFVVMFLPAEAFLYAAVERDPKIIEDAMGNRVIIATPTTLIALLRTFAFGWRQEQLAENAEKIKQAGIELYDRVNKVAEHLQSLGKSLGNAVKHYNSTIASFDGRLLVSARRMGELGARNDKELIDTAQIELQPRLPESVETSTIEL